MSPAKDDAEFGDGTHATPFGDALSGSANEDDADDFQLTRVASPVRPDHSAAREFMVDPAMAADQRPGGEFSAVLDVDGPHFDMTPPASAALPIEPAPPLGILPRQRARPGFRSVRRPSLRMPRLPRPQPGILRRGTKPSSGSAGLILAALLMIVFAVVAIEFLSSLISSISGLFS
jgi:hypothetical protein